MSKSSVFNESICENNTLNLESDARVKTLLPSLLAASSLIGLFALSANSRMVHPFLGRLVYSLAPSINRSIVKDGSDDLIVNHETCLHQLIAYCTRDNLHSWSLLSLSRYFS